MTTYEELYDWFIEYMRVERNKIVTTHGKHSAYEKELQNILISFADATGQDLADLEEATDKNKYYAPGTIIG
ncbi:MAG TPA: hypothetical protein GXX75_05730 [Clostridiales bacterium]|nr:hypothetical protein [Clostridiales bacterium]